MSDKIEWVYGSLAALGSSFATWFFTRKKSAAETKGSELENVEKSLGIYREMLADVKGEFDVARMELGAMREKIGGQYKRVEHLEREIIAMQKRCTSMSCPNFPRKEEKS
jgi:hypothetical protein